MASNNLLRFGVPVTRQAGSGSGVPVRLQTGLCGIPPLKMEPPAPPPKLEKFPEHLMRPPCLPGSKQAKFPPVCAAAHMGFYCPPQRIKYKYPPFSENIDFVPTGDVECWWTKGRTCDLADEEELPIKLP